METIYFEFPDKENTDRTLEIAKEHVQKYGIKNVVVASTTGYTAEKASEVFKDVKVNLVIVTHVTGFLKPDHQQFPEELRKKLENRGIKVLTTTHAFGGINKLFESSIGKIVANTLRMLSEGVKVATEITVMAVDAGLIRTDEDCVAIAGTSKGADTILVVKPANSTRLFDLKIKKILAKPIVE